MIRCTFLILAIGLSAARLAVAEPTVSVSVFEGNVLCIHPIFLSESFAEEVHSLQPTNKIAGTVLDLRFADGDGKSVAEAVKWLAARKAPLAMLVNGQTRGAAAELAARLRSANLGILIGTTNLPGTLATDILIAESPADERKFQTDPFALPATNNVASSSGKNELTAYVDHMSEAELVRKRIKDGEDDGSDDLAPRPGPSQPVIRDPALARAVDLIKALAILKPVHG